MSPNTRASMYSGAEDPDKSSTKDPIKGRIHSIESFSTVDGPGIRFVLFMQGCPLRCIYCQNVDTWMYEDGEEKVVDDILEEIRPQAAFFQKDNGGLTISGGEPLVQAGFAGELFRRVKSELGLTTALDTSGCAPITKDVVFLLEHTDYVLLDVKHVDPVKHVVITGRSMGLIREFVNHIQTIPKLKVWVRHVVVPGYTTDEKDLKAIAEYIASLKNIERVDLLPYHAMGEFKWEIMNRDYALKDIEPPSKEMVLDISKKMELYGGFHANSAFED